jgi:hypothetical protein
MAQHKSLAAVVAVLAVLALSACTPVIRPDRSNPIKTVAVLPLVNNTNDLDGPPYLRALIVTELERHQYAVKPLPEVDQILKDQMGITLGAQLDLTNPQQLGKMLGVDGVLYGSLDEFNHLMTGVYNEKRVRVRTKLVNCANGQTVWKNGIGVKGVLSTGTAGAVVTVASGVVDASKAGDDLPPLFGDPINAPWFELPPMVVGKDSAGDYGTTLAATLGERVVTKAMKAPLPIESNAAVGILLNGTWHDGNVLHQPVRVGAGGIPAGPGR